MGVCDDIALSRFTGPPDSSPLHGRRQRVADGRGRERLRRGSRARVRTPRDAV